MNQYLNLLKGVIGDHSMTSLMLTNASGKNPIMLTTRHNVHSETIIQELITNQSIKD